MSKVKSENQKVKHPYFILFYSFLLIYLIIKKLTANNATMPSTMIKM
jgi:hypothetical protein